MEVEGLLQERTGRMGRLVHVLSVYKFNPTKTTSAFSYSIGNPVYTSNAVVVTNISLSISLYLAVL